MSKLQHHPQSETLAAFAGGGLDEARAVVIAAHLRDCTDCARAVGDFEALGGVMLEETPPATLADDALEKIFARADSAAVMPAASDHDRPPQTAQQMLGDFIDAEFDNVPWSWVAPGVRQYVFDAQGYRKGVLRLVKFEPGKGVPMHSHEGEELTLIMRGAYRDKIGEFRAGDLADLDAEATHSPIAFGDEPCICLIATAAPLRFKTWLGRAMQPFVGL